MFVALAVILTGAVTSKLQADTQSEAIEKASEAEKEATDRAADIAEEQLAWEKERYAEETEAAERRYREQTELEQQRYDESTKRYEADIAREEERYQEQTALEQQRYEEGVGRYEEQQALSQERYAEAKTYAKQVYDEQKEYLAPYIEGGETALTRQMAISGLAGEEAQQAEYDMIKNMPGFQEMIASSEEAILQNAAATGGVRGSDPSKFLARNRSEMLRQEVMDKYNMYGQISGQGQAAATSQVGAAGEYAKNVLAAGAGTLMTGQPSSGTPVTGTGSGVGFNYGGYVPGYSGPSGAGVGQASATLSNLAYSQGQSEASRIMAMGSVNANAMNWLPQSVGFLASYGPNQNNPSYLQSLFG